MRETTRTSLIRPIEPRLKLVGLRPIKPPMCGFCFRSRLLHPSRGWRLGVRAGLVCLASLLPASAFAHGVPEHRPHRPAGIDTDTPFYPEIGIDVRPELEHWPGNYLPDGYHTPGYDGRPGGPHFCRGAHGRQLSSAGAACPKDEKPETGGRHLSSDGG